jgi:hypothetical protein
VALVLQREREQNGSAVKGSRVIEFPGAG